MNLYLMIKRWFSNQEHLYFLFVFLLLIPNYVLVWTEALPVLLGIASFILPLVFTLFIFLTFRKPGIVVWILLPKLIMDAAQLVLLYLFGESVIAVDMFLNLSSSNASEASELLSNLLPMVVFCAILYSFTLGLAIYSIRLKQGLTSKFRKYWAMHSLALGFIAGLLILVATLQGNKLPVKDEVYPLNALYNLSFAIEKYNKNLKFKETSSGFLYHATKDKKTNEREIYVLVIGETGRAMEWSLYGYERETTPLLQRLDGIIHFTDVVTQSNNTHKSVPIILSGASAENYERIYTEKSIMSAFKEAGFRTMVVANQKLTLSMMIDFYQEADIFIDTSLEQKEGFFTSKPDAILLPYLKREIEESQDDLLVVLHTYGSHFKYNQRYTDRFAYWTPDKIESISSSYLKELRNAYDNTILYTDYILNEVISALEQSKACTSMFYLSDHGEDLFDDSRKRYLHASPIPTYYQLHIPYVLWFSEKYINTYPINYKAALDNQHRPVSTNSVFHTLLDLAGIQTVYKDSALSVVNSAFENRPRMYLGDHDEPVPFYKMGLKKEDFEMLDIKGIDYLKE